MTDEQPNPVRFCPFCGSPAVVDRNTRMHDCASQDCRMRFLVGYSRRKRKAPARRQVPS